MNMEKLIKKFQEERWPSFTDDEAKFIAAKLQAAEHMATTFNDVLRPVVSWSMEDVIKVRSGQEDSWIEMVNAYQIYEDAGK